MNSQKFKTGEILVTSWGYDQTNINFYQIVKHTNKSVWIREIAGKKTYDGHMNGTVVPLKDNFLPWSLTDKENRPVRRSILNKSWSGGDYVKIKDYNSARLWDGKPENFSEWA